MQPTMRYKGPKAEWEHIPSIH